MKVTLVMPEAPASLELIAYQLKTLSERVDSGFKDNAEEQGKTNAHLLDLNGKVVKHEKDLTRIHTTNGFALWFLTVVGLPVIGFLLYGIYNMPQTVKDVINDYSIEEVTS